MKEGSRILREQHKKKNKPSNSNLHPETPRHHPAETSPPRPDNPLRRYVVDLGSDLGCRFQRHRGGVLLISKVTETWKVFDKSQKGLCSAPKGLLRDYLRFAMEWLKCVLVSALGKMGKIGEHNCFGRPYIYHISMGYIIKKKLPCHKSQRIVEIQLGFTARCVFTLSQCDDGNLPETPCTQNRIDFGFAISTTINTWTEISYKKNNKGQLNVPNLPTFLRQAWTRVLWTIRSTSTVSSDHRGHLECMGIDQSRRWCECTSRSKRWTDGPQPKIQKRTLRDFLHPMTRKLYRAHYYKI